MKKLIALFLLIISVSLRPESVMADVYIDEDFDDLSSGVPVGWDNFGGTTTTASYRWNYAQGVGRNGSGCLMFNGSFNGIGSTNYLRTPYFTPGPGVNLKFWFKNKSGDKCKVCIEVDGQPLDETKPLIDNMVNLPEWNEYVVSLDSYRGKRIRVVFISVSKQGFSNSYNHYLDDLSIVDPALCAKPVALSVSGVTQIGANLSWGHDIEGADSARYILNVKDLNGSAIVDNEVIYAPYYSYWIKGLSEFTSYAVTLQTDCHNGQLGYSEVSDVLYFTTLVSPVSLPLYENFDSVEDEIPEGWLRNENNPQGTVAQLQNKYGSNGKGLKLSSTDVHSAYIVTPQIDYAADDMQVEMMIMGEAGTEYSLGVVTDPSDISTFLPISTGTIAKAKIWQEVRFTTLSLSDNSVNYSIAVVVQTGENNVLYIDNFQIISAASCIRPEKLNTDVVHHNRAVLSWLQDGDAQSYQIRIDDEENVTYQTSTVNPATVNLLSAETEYEVSVRAICAEGDSSEWSLPTMFMTRCGIMESPLFFNSFENASDFECWQSVNSLRTGDNVGGWSVDATQHYSGSKALKAAKASAGTRNILVSQALNVDAVNKYELRFYVYRASSYDRDITKGDGVQVWLNNRPDMEGAVPALPFIHSYIEHSPEERAAGWYQYEAPIAIAGEVYLIFEYVSQNVVDLYVDDVEVIVAPSCRRVKDIVVGDMESDNFTVSWTPADESHNLWVMRYTMTSGNDVVNNSVVVSEPSCTVGGLQSNYAFSLDVSVATVCAPGDTSEWVSVNGVQLQTECDPYSAFPYIEDFEGGLFPPECWQQKQNVAGTLDVELNDLGDDCWAGNANMDYVAHGNRSAALQLTRKDTHTLLSTQALDFFSGKKYRLSFFVYNKDSQAAVGDIKVWLSDSRLIDGAEELVLVSTGASRGNMQQYVAEIPSSAVGAHHIVFEGISDGESVSYIDYVVVADEDYCEEIFGYEVVNITNNSFEMVCSDISVVDWEVEYGSGNIVASQSGADVISITGLQSDTDYSVRVRRKCGSSYSLWSDVNSVRTLCDPIDVSVDAEYFDGFENGSFDKCLLVRVDANNLNIEEPRETNMRIVNSCGDSDDGGISPCEGLYFAYNDAGSKNTICRSFYLRAGVNYEMSGYFCVNAKADYGATASLYIADKPLGNMSQPLVSDQVIEVGKWNKVLKCFTVATDGIYYLCWQVRDEAWASSYLAIDNIRLRVVNCLPPTTVRFSSVTTTSASLFVEHKAKQIEVKVAALEFDPMMTHQSSLVYSNTLSYNTVDITGLESGVEYFYSIRTICDSGEMSDWSDLFSFRTACAAKKLPYLETFESSDDMECWNISELSHESLVERSTDKSVSVPYSLRVKKDCQIVLPLMDLPKGLDGYQIVGRVLSAKADAIFGIGMMENPYDLNTYEPVMDVAVENAGVWKEFSVIFSGEDVKEMENMRYAVINTIKDSELYFDDIELFAVPTCSRPSIPLFSELGSNSVTVDWLVNGSEERWNVVVRNAGIVVVDSIVDHHPYTITGLSENRTYSLEVAAVCDDHNKSVFARFGEFTTECGAKGVPYDEDFNSIANKALPNCWVQINNQVSELNDRPCGAYMKQMRINVHSGNVAKGEYVVLETPDFDLTAALSAKLSFDIKNAGDSVYVLLSKDGGETYPIVLYGGGYTNTMTTYVYDLNPYLNHIVKIAFKIRSRGTETSKMTYIDNFRIIAEESCVRPADISAVGSTPESITVAFSDTAGNVGWQYVYGNEGFDYRIVNEVYDVANDTFTIEGLLPFTKYDVYVRSACVGNSVSTWRGPVSVRTTCAALECVPYFEGFEGYAELKESCVAIKSENGKHDPYTTGGYPQAKIYKHGGRNVLRLYSSTKQRGFAVLPEFSVPANELKVSFEYSNDGTTSYDGNLHLGVLPDVNDLSSFVSLVEYPKNVEYSVNEYDLADLDLQYASARVAFAFVGGSGGDGPVNIDNIQVVMTDHCQKMESPKLVAVDKNSAVLSVKSLADSVEVVWGEAGVYANNCTSFLTSKMDTITIEGLSEGFPYYFYVRPACDGAPWSDALSVTTECDKKVLDEVYVENFDSYGSMQIPFPPCISVVESSSISGTEYPRLIESSNEKGAYSLLMRGINRIALPLFDKENHHLCVEFSTVAAKTNEDMLLIGFQDDLSDMATFKAVDTVRFGVKELAERHSVDMSVTGLRGKYIVFATTSSSAYVYVDSLEVSLVSSCYEPRNMMLVAVDSVSAFVKWTIGYDIPGGEYMIFADGVEGEPVALGAQVDSICLTGLRPGTDYVLQVRNLCDEGGYTEWVSLNFKTMSLPMSLPYSHGFEDDVENDNWQLLSDGNGNTFVIGSSAAKDGEKGLYISYDQMVVSTAYAYRTVYLEAGSLYELAYDWKCDADSISYARAFVVPYMTDLLSLDIREDSSKMIMADAGVMNDKDIFVHNSTEFSVPQTGYYNIVFASKDTICFSTELGNATLLAIDNVSVREIKCRMFDSVKIADVMYNAIAMDVDDKYGASQIICRVMDGDGVEEQPVLVDTLEMSPRVILKGLQPLTSYKLYVQAYCGEELGCASDWNCVGTFTTPCGAEPVAETGFFDSFETYGDGTNNIGCWYNIRREEGSPIWEVKTTQDRAFECSANTASGYVRLNYNSAAELSRLFTLRQNRTYELSFFAKKANLNGFTMSLIVRDERVTDTLLTTEMSEAGYKKYSARFTAPETGDYFVGVYAQSTNQAFYLAIDDVSFVPMSAQLPYGLRVTDSSANGVALNWNEAANAEKYQVQVLMSGTSVIVVDEFVSDAVFSTTALRSSSDYVARVRGVNDNDSSEWISVDFATECGKVETPVFISFDDMKYLPKCWDNVSASEINKTTNWGVHTDDVTGNGYMRIEASRVDGNAVVLTTPYNVTNGVSVLSFDYIGNYSDYPLVVAISSDGGITFPDTVLQGRNVDLWSAVSHSLDMYEGREIVIGFSVRSDYNLNESKYFGVDNFRINCQAESKPYNVSVCKGSGDYEGFGFSIPEHEISKVGTYRFTKTFVAVEDGACDTFKVLNVTVLNGGTYHVNDTICKGDVYNKGAFSGQTTSGTYTSDVLKTADGCDSIAILHLTVLDLVVPVSLSICEGGGYRLGDRLLTESGMYRDTVTNSRGCDSITILTLSVVDTYYRDTLYLCEGEVCQWQDTTLTTTGVYERVYKNRLGCDSIHMMNLVVLPAVTRIDTTICRGNDVIVANKQYTEGGVYTINMINTLNCDSTIILDLTVVDADTTYIYDVACEGNLYYGYGFYGELLTADTEIIERRQTVDGCDSIIMVSIDYVETVEVDTTVAIKDGEVYVIGGNTISTPGEYDITLTSDNGCDSIVHLTLVVETGVNNLHLGNLIIAPNPINVGEVAYIISGLSGNDCGDLIVEVLNSVGQIVYRGESERFPVMVAGIVERGVYLIRVVDCDGNIYAGKLIVR